MPCRRAEQQGAQTAAEAGREGQGACAKWEGSQGYLDILREWNLNTSTRKISVSLDKPKYFILLLMSPMTTTFPFMS